MTAVPMAEEAARLRRSCEIFSQRTSTSSDSSITFCCGYLAAVRPRKAAMAPGKRGGGGGIEGGREGRSQTPGKVAVRHERFEDDG